MKKLKCHAYITAQEIVAHVFFLILFCPNFFCIMVCLYQTVGQWCTWDQHPLPPFKKKKKKKLDFTIFQGVAIFKSSPQPQPAMDYLQTIRFGKLKVNGFRYIYMSANAPGGGGGG